MEVLTRSEIRLLAEVAEIKRIYTAVANHLAAFRSPSLVITSAERGEGKSSMSSLIAMVASEYGHKRVLVVDLHWHRPTLHQHFGLERNVRLEEGTSLIDYVVPSGFKGLDILTAPVSSVDEQYSSGDILTLVLSTLESAKEHFDLIILDTAAMFPTNRHMLDPVVISSAADAVALVVLSSVTPRQSVRKALISLETAGSTVVGAIVNQWKNPISE